MVQGTTSMVKEQEVILLLASVAVQETVVVPTGKHIPEAGEQLTITPGQLSVGVGVV
jgi:hypothetical protein